MKMPRVQGAWNTRSVCYTVNNYTPEQVALVIACNRAPCTGHVAYFEVSESKTPHIQGYIEFKDNKSQKGVMMHFGFHVDKILDRKGSAQEAWEYCRKGDLSHEEYVRGAHPRWEHPHFGRNAKPLFEDYGECSHMGRPSSFPMAVHQIASGYTMREVARDYPEAVARYSRGLQNLRVLLQEERDLEEMPDVTVYYGDTGTCKSRTVNDRKKVLAMHGEFMYKWAPAQSQWFDLYDGHTVIHLEEFRGQMPLADLLELCDRYSCRRPTKGSFVEIVADTFYITSPSHPRMWYRNVRADLLTQLDRRITTIIRCWKTELPGGKWEYHQETVEWSHRDGGLERVDEPNRSFWKV